MCNMNIYIYIYTHTHTHIHIHVHISLSLSLSLCIYIYIYIYTHIYTYIYIYIYVYTHVRPPGGRPWATPRRKTLAPGRATALGQSTAPERLRSLSGDSPETLGRFSKVRFLDPHLEMSRGLSSEEPTALLPRVPLSLNEPFCS